MKQITLATLIIIACANAAYAQSSTPVYLGTAYPQGTSAYQEHGQQGNEMYQNNSQWYNKDNVPPQAFFPSSNGQYVLPGNSNAINTRMYDGANITTSPGTIYDSGVPATNAGTYPSSGSEAYIRD